MTSHCCKQSRASVCLGFFAGVLFLIFNTFVFKHIEVKVLNEARVSAFPVRCGDTTRGRLCAKTSGENASAFRGIVFLRTWSGRRVSKEKTPLGR